jgi:hypothetical protein
VSVSFCNNGTGNTTNKHTIMIEPWEQQEICIYVQNNSSEDVVVKYSFPKASFSPWWNQICSTSNEFEKFLLDNPNRNLVVSWNSSVVLKETVVAPLGMIWMYYGCLAYQLEKPEVENMWGVFNLVVRKAIHLNLFVGSEDSISNTIQLAPVTWSIYSSNKNVWANINEDWDLILNFAIKNNWNLTQSGSLEGKLYNPLWFEKTISVPSKKLLPGDMYEASVNLGIIPAYKWLFSVRFTLTSEPVFEFDVSEIDDKYKQSIVIKETWSLFVFSWIYVILALIIVWLIVKIVVPKKKKV